MYYIAIDMKSFYASVECVARGLDPLTTNLLVADSSRSDQTICLAVSPSLKAIGVPGRPRLFEAKQAIRSYERRTGRKVEYITAVPRMRLYEEVSAKIYSILLNYAAAEDIHVYSIDESFIDSTPYLKHYTTGSQSAPHIMAMTMIRDILSQTGITATVGIGTNLYLAKIAMDIVAKKQQPDQDGVRIAELTEKRYQDLLWDHTPLTDFWMIGSGKARTLEQAGLHTMGDIAEYSQFNEEWFYKKFGIDAEILIDHAWGIEPVRMQDIKNFRPETNSLSNGQVLPRPYHYEEARLVFSEMVEELCHNMFTKNVLSKTFVWWVSYDYKSLEEVPYYDGPLSIDFYGRLHPKHSNGTVRVKESTNSTYTVKDLMLSSFDQKTDHRLLYRRLGVSANQMIYDDGYYQLDMFTDYEKLQKERQLQTAIHRIHSLYGANAMVKGSSLMEGSTIMERNTQIGGHKA